MQKPVAENEDEEPQPEELTPIGYVPDLLADAKIFEWAGVGFGEVETYRIMKSLKVSINSLKCQKLATETSAGNIRFFGKIQATQADYYIAEGTLEGGDDGEEVERPPEFEARGTGVNKFVYWVTTDILGKWTKLPDLLPSDIDAARQIKVLLTGDLEKKIYTNPFFFGQEKHYLRAQIARISHSTTIIPKGLFKTVEDNEKDIEEFVPDEGELQMPSTHQMAVADNWVHFSPSILKVARTAHIEPEVPEGAPEEVTAETLLADLEARDPYDKRLKPITLDAQIPVAEKTKQMPWVVKLMGDKNVYADPAVPKKQVNYGVVVVRSLQWPGAFTLYSQGRYLSIYVGNGLKYETQTYYPINPPLIMEDPGDMWPEQPEPTPLFEEVIQPDEDGVEGQEEGNDQFNDDEDDNE